MISRPFREAFHTLRPLCFFVCLSVCSLSLCLYLSLSVCLCVSMCVFVCVYPPPDLVPYRCLAIWGMGLALRRS